MPAVTAGPVRRGRLRQAEKRQPEEQTNERSHDASVLLLACRNGALNSAAAEKYRQFSGVREEGLRRQHGLHLCLSTRFARHLTVAASFCGPTLFSL